MYLIIAHIKLEWPSCKVRSKYCFYSFTIDTIYYTHNPLTNLSHSHKHTLVCDAVYGEQSFNYKEDCL